MLSIRSKADASNYVYLDKYGLTIYGASVLKAIVGKFNNGTSDVYGAWFSDNLYIGGATPASAPIQIVGSATSISLGGLYAAAGQSYISGANGSFSTSGGLSTNYLSGTASGATMGITDSQVSAGSGGAEIKQKVSVDTTKGWSQYNNYYIQFGVGTTYGASVRAQFGRLAADVYGSWMTGGVYIGGATYDVSEVRLTASTLEMGYVSANVYNMTLTSSLLSIGRTGSYYNTKIESGAISLGHLSSGTNYALTMDYSGAEAARYFSIKAADLTEYFRIARYQIDGVYNNGVWAKKLLLMDSYSGDITSYSGYDGVNTRLYIVNPPAVGSAGCAAAIFSYYDIALECRTTYATAIYANAGSSGLTTHGIHGISFGGNGSTYPYEDSAGVKGEGGSTSSVTGVYGYSYAGFGVRATSTTGYAMRIDHSHTSNYTSYGTVKFVNTVAYNGQNGIYGGTALSFWHACAPSNTSTEISRIISVNENYYNPASPSNVNFGNICFQFKSYNSSAWNDVLKIGYYTGVNIYSNLYVSWQVSCSLVSVTNNYTIDAITGSSYSYGVNGYTFTSTDGNMAGVYGHTTYGVGAGVKGVGNNGSSVGGYFSNGSTYQALETNGTVKMLNLSAAGTGTVLVIDGSGWVKPQSSSIRYKDILSSVEDYSMDKFNQLVPYKFRFKESGDLDIGFISEWILPIFPDLVNFNKYGQPESLKYDRFCVYNILATQEHDKIIKQQQNEIDNLKQILIELKNKVDTLTKTE